MLKKYLPVLVLLVALCAGYALLADSPEEAADGLDWAEQPREGGSTAGEGGTGLTAAGVRPAPPDAPSGHTPVEDFDPRTRPRGALLVSVAGPDDVVIDSASLHIYVDPVRKGGFKTRLGAYDPAARVWRFERVPAGQVQVLAFSDHIVRTVQVVPVRAEEENAVTLKVILAGAIQYDVIAYDKTRPEKVTLMLYDAQEQLVRAWYEVRALRSGTTPREATTITQGPEGVILGLLPGTYRLKVISQNDEWDEANVVVTAGATQAVSLEVRR